MSTVELKIKYACIEDLEKLQNLARFYLYDMSRNCGFLKGWEMPESGLYEYQDLSRYFNEPERYPFLIQVGGELAGFALINKVGSLPDVDWCLGEFFVTAKYQGKGIGQEVAISLFDMFPGMWEVMQVPENKPAVCFWEKVVRLYKSGDFTKELKIVKEVSKDPRVVLRFKSKSKRAFEEVQSLDLELSLNLKKTH